MAPEGSHTLSLFAVFHLNLAYSAIEVEQRPEVIRKCYWPLLRLARDLDLPLGIEAPAYTLETIAALDPDWLAALRELTARGPCEFVGSGYAQLIGPLVPAPVNIANLRLGHEAYQRLLGFRPALALVNEQAYAAGLVPLYRQAGYEAIIMEWNNAARYHPEWPRVWRYLPQRAQGPNGESLPLIWNDAIAFQKFQRYAHGELELDEYLAYLEACGQAAVAALGGGGGVFPLYGNDGEIFDFRPGRYATEGSLHPEGEWPRLGRLFETLSSHPRLELIAPSRVLSRLGHPQAGQPLRLESPEQPIPVKKQEKYNISRWAVTGRDDLGINSACWRLFQALEADPEADGSAWQELCYLWSSDFRTHITASRWQAYQKRLAAAEARWGHVLGAPETVPAGSFGGIGTHAGWLPREAGAASSPPAWEVVRQGRFLKVNTPRVRIILNCRRGLAIEALGFPAVNPLPLIGTLPHGYYEDIALAADFYSGHTILEIPGCRRLTDLNPAAPEWRLVHAPGGTAVQVQAMAPLEAGRVRKTLEIYLDHSRVDLSYAFELAQPLEGAWRTGILTFIPTAFHREQVFYRTHNGGYDPETFALAGRRVEHSEPASVLVSARQGLGASGGWVAVGDHRSQVNISFDPGMAAMLPLVSYQEGPEHFFLRLYFSLRELDETRRWEPATLRLSPLALSRQGRLGAPGGMDLLALEAADGDHLTCGLTITAQKTGAPAPNPGGCHDHHTP